MTPGRGAEVAMEGWVQIVTAECPRWKGKRRWGWCAVDERGDGEHTAYLSWSKRSDETGDGGRLSLEETSLCTAAGIAYSIVVTTPRADVPPVMLIAECDREFQCWWTALRHCILRVAGSIVTSMVLPDTPPVFAENTTSYTPTALLGQGAYSKVVKARHIASHKEYAVKVISKPALLRNRNPNCWQVRGALLERRILEEVRHHPRFVTMETAFQDHVSLYFVLDWVRGGELSLDLLARKKDRTPVMQHVLVQMGAALDHLRALGYIHRDVKPENILVTAHGHCQLTDFGLSCRHPRKGRLVSEFTGTPGFLAPEVVGLHTTYYSTGYDYEVDWWSLGAVAYWMATLGKLPVDYCVKSQSMDDVYESLQLGSKRWREILEHLLGADGSDAVMSLLELHPKRRTTSVSQLINLKWFAKSGGGNWHDVATASSGSPPTSPIRVKPTTPRAEVTTWHDALSGGTSAPPLPSHFHAPFDGFSFYASDSRSRDDDKEDDEIESV